MELVKVTDGRAAITERDLMIVEMLCEGYTVTQIAKLKNMNRRGLEGTVAILKRKTGLKTHAGIVATFFRQGLIQ